jgi:hypothetical protein
MPINGCVAEPADDALATELRTRGHKDDKDAAEHVTGKTRLNPLQSDGRRILLPNFARSQDRQAVRAHPPVHHQEIEYLVTDRAAAMLSAADWSRVIWLRAAIPFHPAHSYK